MKKSLILLTALCGLFLASCKQQDAAPNESDEILNSMEASSARSAAVSDTVTKQKCKGKLTSIEITALAASITTYINTNYAGATIKFAGKDDKGQTVVGLELNSVRTGLLFDANGAFVQKLEKFGQKSKLTKVEVAALPTTITAYVTANYATFTIKRAGTDADGNFIVGIKNDTDHKVLKFDATGKFVEEMAIPPHTGQKKKR
jgi:outer membrane lipoprotein-sorting protein